MQRLPLGKVLGILLKPSDKYSWLFTLKVIHVQFNIYGQQFRAADSIQYISMFLESRRKPEDLEKTQMDINMSCQRQKQCCFPHQVAT